MNRNLLLVLLCTYGYTHSMHEFSADLPDSTRSSWSADHDRQPTDMADFYRRQSRDAQLFEKRPTTKLREEAATPRPRAVDPIRTEAQHVTFRDVNEVRPEQRQRVDEFARRHDLSAENQTKLVGLFEKINALRPEEQRNVQQALHEFTRLTPEQQTESLERLQSHVTELENERSQSARGYSGRYTDPYGNYYQDPFVNTYMDVQETFFLLDLFNSFLEILGSLGSGAVEMASSINIGDLASLFL